MEKVGYVLVLAITACGGHTGSGGKNGTGDEDISGAPPACVADGTVAPPGSPVSGSVVGAQLRAALCAGGATAYVEIAPGSLSVASQPVFILEPTTDGDPRTRFTIELPKQAIEGGLVVLLGMSEPAPGTYSSESDCGSLGLCVTLPLPANLVCTGSDACSPGCALQGPVSGPTCQPVMPQVCYGAQAARNCVGGTVVPHGSWSLTLTSVDEYAQDANAPLEKLVAHGTLTAVLLNDDGDSAQLSLAF
jgi:hypothetical protein